MKGKKRKSGRREPNGRIQRNWENPAALNEANRIKRAIERDAGHPLHGFPFGALYATGRLDGNTDSRERNKEIAGDLYNAGCAWAALTARYAVIHGLPVPHARAINWEGAQGRRLAADPDDDEIERINTAKELQDREIRRAGRLAMVEMQSVILLDREPGDLTMLKAALTNLADLRNVKRRAA